MSPLTNSGPDARPHTKPIDLSSSIRDQSWSWLREIERRLDFVAQILDESGTPCLTAQRGTFLPPRALSSQASPSAASPALGSALSSVLHTNRTQRLTIDGVATVFCPLSVGRSSVGALVLSRQPYRISIGGNGADRALEEIASWLARAVQAQLNLPVDDSEAFDRVASLHKLLQESVDGGVEPDVISAFAEALIAWDDLEVRGYVQDGQGHFVLSIATPGVDRQQAASIAPGDVVPMSPHLTRLSPAESHRAGFRHDHDVFMAHIGGRHAQPWLLAVSGAIRPDDEPRLSLYLDLLREAVDRAATIAETRVSWAILQRLLGAHGDITESAGAALDDLKRAIGAERIALHVDGARGTRGLTAGDTALVSESESGKEPGRDLPASVDRVVSMVSLPEGDTLTLRAERPRTQPFTKREQQLVDRAASIFSAWLAGVKQRPVAPPERRAETRQFQQVLDRSVDQSLREGLDVAIVVILAPSVTTRAGLLQQWVSDIRARLRGGDLAGMLSEREIGILLAGAGASDVSRVSARVCQPALQGQASDLTPVSIGFAARNAGVRVDTSLVAEARQDAARRGKRESQGLR